MIPASRSTRKWCVSVEGLSFPAVFAIRPDELAVAVEERGFESLFFTEHTHLPCSPAALHQTGHIAPHYSHTYDLYVSLSFAARATTTLLIGSGVTLVPEHDPFNAAKALASIDVLSGGRLLWGIGSGWVEEELRNHGADPARRWTTTVEFVQAIRTIWTNEVAEYHGRYVDFGPIWSWPKPLRPEGPPLLVGGNGPRVPERAVEFGDEWFPEDHQTAEELAERIVQLQAMAQAAGRAPLPVSLFGTKPDLEHLKKLDAAGVSRVVFYVPSADQDTVLAKLDEHVALREAFSR